MGRYLKWWRKEWCEGYQSYHRGCSQRCSDEDKGGQAPVSWHPTSIAKMRVVGVLNSSRDGVYPRLLSSVALAQLGNADVDRGDLMSLLCGVARRELSRHRLYRSTVGCRRFL